MKITKYIEAIYISAEKQIKELIDFFEDTTENKKYEDYWNLFLEIAHLIEYTETIYRDFAFHAKISVNQIERYKKYIKFLKSHLNAQQFKERDFIAP